MGRVCMFCGHEGGTKIRVTTNQGRMTTRICSLCTKDLSAVLDRLNDPAFRAYS